MSGERTTLLNSERLKYRQIKVEEVGVHKELRDEVHAKANHYIEESRPYFPNAQLPKYIDCPYFLRVARLVCFASLICTLVVKISGSEYIIPNFRPLNGLNEANWPKIGSGSSAVGEESVTSPKNVCVEGYKSTKEGPLSRNGTAISDRSAPPTNAGRIQI